MIIKRDPLKGICHTTQAATNVSECGCNILLMLFSSTKQSGFRFYLLSSHKVILLHMLRPPEGWSKINLHGIIGHSTSRDGVGKLCIMQ